MAQARMNYRRLGSTGLLVSELGLGTNTFGGKGEGFWEKLGALGQAEANKIVGRAFAAGINFIDTADMYGLGESEVIVGEAIRSLGCPRDEIVLATKIGAQFQRHVNGLGASRGHIMAAVDGSLKRLKLDHIDLLMMHFFDPATPLEETLGALDDCVRAGKVRYIGCSNYTGWQVVKAVETSRRMGVNAFAVVETHWSAATREIERELLPAARSEGVGMLIWGALLGGILSGKYADGAASSGRMAGIVPGTLNAEGLAKVVAILGEIGAKRRVAPASVALAWLLSHREVSSVLFGARTPEQVDENLRATELTLDAEEIAAIDAAAPPSRDHFMMVTRNSNLARLPYAR